jgi:hypothetical protein
MADYATLRGHTTLSRRSVDRLQSVGQVCRFGRRVDARTPRLVAHQDHHPRGPRLCCFHRSTRLKQYFKEHWALRTELVVSESET